MRTSVKYTVAAGTPVEHVLLNNTPTTVKVVPAGTCVVAVKIAATGAYVDVADGLLTGALAAAATDVLMGPAHALRFTATTDAAVVEISQ